MTTTFHNKDAEFDFVKNKRGDLVVSARKHISSSQPNLILCNETCPIQFAYLEGSFAPLYATMDFDQKTGRAGVRAIGMFEIIGRACGLRFP